MKKIRNFVFAICIWGFISTAYFLTLMAFETDYGGGFELLPVIAALAFWIGWSASKKLWVRLAVLAITVAGLTGFHLVQIHYLYLEGTSFVHSSNWSIYRQAFAYFCFFSGAIAALVLIAAHLIGRRRK